jgi:hypothetical protein
MCGGVAGERTSETVSDVVSMVDPVMPLYTAVMTAEPVNVPAVARPETLIPAMFASDEAHVALVVRFCVLPFEYVPNAVNCMVVLGAMLGPDGVTVIDLRVAVGAGVSLTLPHPVSISAKIIPAIAV